MISYFSFKMQNNCVTLQAEVFTPAKQKNAKYAKNEWFKVRHTLCAELKLKVKHFVHFLFYCPILYEININPQIYSRTSTPYFYSRQIEGQCPKFNNISCFRCKTIKPIMYCKT